MEAASTSFTLRDRADLAVGGLVAVVVLTWVALMADLVQVAVLRRGVVRGYLTDGESTLNTAMDVVALFQLLVFVVAAVLFIRWFRRAYLNLRAFGVSPLPYRTWWTIGGWLIPIANLFRPKQIADHVWRASDPELARGEQWSSRRVPRLHHWWWATFVASTLLYNIGTRAQGGFFDTADLAGLRNGSVIFAFADGLGVIAGVLAIVVVSGTTRSQEERAIRLRLMEQPAVDAATTDTGVRRRTVVVGGSALVVVSVALGAFVLTAGDMPERVPGLVFADPFSDSTSGWPVQDDGEATFAYEDGLYRIHVKTPDSAWIAFRELPDGPRTSIAIAVDGRLDGASSGDELQLGCWRADTAGYLFVLTPDGSYVIGREPQRDRGEPVILDEGTLPGGRAFDIDEMNALRAACSREGRRARVSLALDNRQIATAVDTAGSGPFVAVSLGVYAKKAGTEARFDNAVVSRP